MWRDGGCGGHRQVNQARVDTTTVGEIASDDPHYVNPDQDLDEALDLMAYRQVRRLLVVDDDQLVGILAQADVVHEVKDKKAGQLVEQISQT